MTFLGGVAEVGERIARVRITSGVNAILSDGVLGNPNDDDVAMGDFINAEPVAVTEPTSLVLTGLGLVAVFARSRRRRA